MEVSNVVATINKAKAYRIESGATMEVVRDRLGHTDIQTTVNIYTHITQKSRDKTAQNFANFMGI